MRKRKVFIATSLDGYISREDGALDWLTEFPNPDNLDYGYADFISGVDVIVIGKTTYMEILGYGVERPYKDCTTYVVTHDKDFVIKTPNTHVMTNLSLETMKKVSDVALKDIWILGGGCIISQCLDLGIIDEMVLSIIPIVLGSGIPLFSHGHQETLFSLIEATSFPTGVVNLHYAKSRE